MTSRTAASAQHLAEIGKKREKLFNDLKQLQEQKSMLMAKDEIYEKYATLKTDLEEKNFRIEYLERQLRDKEQTIVKLEMETYDREQ
mmetsp:Transcript_9333/g.14109  ORF Transcript_9333/g.14109 Transcript_9333/m.14109 type:complete len:87 (-) Transcript_9333:579-839(-)|eukprot:CAMPEP_0170502206 /NCGR_PEP_ID=MMETSP0208-20121228/40791_1 /TAXON_ID=197538 /ORGANISM="Strombidium inclinatum, Strain S3" /LENGTH=86 /DNA_ID=CAMNT_0010781147 /DNA_START=181 /DNA_END=441 /DNA_ORIENTATION=-